MFHLYIVFKLKTQGMCDYFSLFYWKVEKWDTKKIKVL